MFFLFLVAFYVLLCRFLPVFELEGHTKRTSPTPSQEIARATSFYSVTGIFGATPSSFAFGIFSFR